MSILPKTGDRIRLVEMPHDPNPIAVGQTGTVVSIRQIGSGQDCWFQIDVEWDDGRTLMLSTPPDDFEIIPH
jgi:hypothetical protein